MQTLWAALHRLPTADFEFLLLALALYVASLFIAAARWRTFLRAMGEQTGLRQAVEAITAGIAVNNVTPSSRLGGEACRIAFIKMTGGTRWQAAATATLWDRLSELPCVTALAILSGWAVRRMVPAWRVAVLVLAAALLTALVIVGWRKIGGERSTVRRWRNALAFDRVTARSFVIGVAWSFALWLLDVVRLVLVARAFHVALAPSGAALLSILTIVGGLAPTIGGLGAVEGVLVAGLMALGVDAPRAVAITAGERAISFGFATILGSVVIATRGGHSLWMTVRSSARQGGRTDALNGES